MTWNFLHGHEINSLTLLKNKNLLHWAIICELLMNGMVRKMNHLRSRYVLFCWPYLSIFHASFYVFFVWKFLLKIIQSIQHKTIFTKMLKLKINCRKTVKVIDGFRHSPFTSPRSFSFLQNLSIITIFIRLP